MAFSSFFVVSNSLRLRKLQLWNRRYTNDRLAGPCECLSGNTMNAFAGDRIRFPAIIRGASPQSMIKSCVNRADHHFWQSQNPRGADRADKAHPQSHISMATERRQNTGQAGGGAPGRVPRPHDHTERIDDVDLVEQVPAPVGPMGRTPQPPMVLQG